MSNAIFTYLDTNKEQIFEMYDKPKYYIESYCKTCDGAGFLWDIIEDEHPVLRKYIVNDDSKQEPPPQFHQYTSINTFVNAYIRFIECEEMRGRQHTDKEKIDHIRNSLDDRFLAAKEKI